MDLEALEKLKQLTLELKQQMEDDSSSDSSDGEKKPKKDSVEAKMPSTLHLLYAASRLRIYKLADKIAANQVSKDIPLRETEILPEIIQKETWEFKLGDWVRIKKEYTVQDFKSIQKRTLGWNARLRTIYGCEGVVTARWSSYENGVTIYTPERLSTSSVYAGLLEVIPDQERKVDTSFTTQWKVDDYVTTIMDEKVVQLMQKRLDTIPQRYLGRKGRIIAVTRVAIVVTFNERTSYDINSYLLVKCEDQTPLEVRERVHDRFEVGEMVRVISNMKQLVNNQKDHGGWSDDMSTLSGKQVRIVHICKNKNLRVQYKLGRQWVMNPESLNSLSDPVKETTDADCEFLPGDIVKIKMTNNMRSLMQRKNVPMIFLDYLRSTAKVKLVDDDFDYLIKYNCDQNVSVYAPTIRKATMEEREYHQQVKHEVSQIKTGSAVFLDVGPPNFVKAVLKDSNPVPDVIHALTHQSTLVGFAEDNRAVIEYKDGKRFKIKRRFLTVPGKFNMQGSIDGMGFETAKEIQETFANCVQMLKEDGEPEVEKPVRILAMSFDTTPTVDLRVFSLSASVEKICETLLTVFEWDIQQTYVDEAVMHVKGLKSFDREVKITLYFNQEQYTKTTPGHIPETTLKPCKCKVGAREIEGRHQTIGANLAAEACKVPMNEDCGGAEPEHSPPDDVKPQSLDDFQYIPFPRMVTERPIYLPFYVPGNPRPVRDHPRREIRLVDNTGSGTPNIFNITNLNNLNNINH